MNSTKHYLWLAAIVVLLGQTHSLRADDASSGGHVYLSGQVHQQGAVEIPAGETLTVLKAIILDGGFADLADTKHVKLLCKKADGTPKTIVVDTDAITDQPHPEDPVVHAGDIIVVPQRIPEDAKK